MAPRAVTGPIQPRGLTREDAAAYCGLSPEGFDEWVSAGLSLAQSQEHNGGTGERWMSRLTAPAAS